MMQESRIAVWHGTRSVNVREVDFTVENLARMFKLVPSSVYLINDSGDVIMPSPMGYIDDVAEGSRCEVCGDEEDPTSTAPATPQTRQPPRTFQFQVRPSASASHAGPPPPRPARMFTRSITIGRVERGQLCMDAAALYIEASHNHATVASMTQRVKAELKTDETIVLFDGQGYKLVESSGTSGIMFWKQNARKIVALTDTAFNELQRGKRRRTSAYGDDTKEKIEELLLAAEALPAISQSLRDLGQYSRANRVSNVALTEAHIASVKATFQCVICRDVMDSPVATPCCRSLIGCEVCVQQWVLNEYSCPKCRDPGFKDSFFRMTGMGDVINILRETIRE